MINFYVGHYIAVTDFLDEQICKWGIDPPSPEVDNDNCNLIEAHFQHIASLARNLGIRAASDRIERAMSFMEIDQRPSGEMAFHLRTVREAFEDGISRLGFYVYEETKLQRMLLSEYVWKEAIAAFPSIAVDVKSATDLYALGHNTASVFHCMRVLEIGIGALAKDCGLTFTIQQWQNILDEIEKKIGQVRSHGVVGLDKAAKDLRLQFLSEAAKEFFYFKDGWRNYVSHNKGTYDENQAFSVLEHVQSFMNRLSQHLSEEVELISPPC